MTAEPIDAQPAKEIGPISEQASVAALHSRAEQLADVTEAARAGFPALSPCGQLGFVVRDMDAALALYGPLFGPFTMMNNSYNYRSEQAEVDL